MSKKLGKFIVNSLVLTSVALITSCARHPTDPKNDPFEGYNRFMFAFNMDVDHLVLRPTAIVYQAVTPPVLKKGVTNFFKNIGELPTMGNDLLQGNFKYIALDFWRFVINSTLGVGGLFDIATRVGLRKHEETFGLTLAKWRGGKSAAYFVIPILGASTVQDTIGLAADLFMTPWPYLQDQNISYVANGVWIVNKREQLLAADEMVKNAFSPYIFVRDAKLQEMKHKIAENQALYSKKKPEDTDNAQTVSFGLGG